MRPGPPPAAIYQKAAAQLAAALDAGDDVAYLCQGDPLFYGSFAGILTLLAARYTVAVVPGVSSLTACAAAAATPLVQRDETLSVIPAGLPEDALALRAWQRPTRPRSSSSAGIFRSCDGSSRSFGLLDGAIYVERASLPNQRIAPLATIEPASVPYFAMALVHRGRQRMKPVLRKGAAVVVLGPGGAALGRRVCAVLPGARLYGPRASPGDWDEAYDRVVPLLAELFAAGRPIVGLCASGILIRALAPLLDDKREEPPVVALAEDGSVAVPLLGRTSRRQRARPRAGRGAGRASPRSPPPAICGSASRSTSRRPAGVSPTPSGSSRSPPRCSPASRWRSSRKPPAPIGCMRARCAGTRQRATDRSSSPTAHCPAESEALVFHPPVLALGIGCERGCPAEEIAALARASLAEAGLAAGAVAAIVSIELKADEPGDPCAGPIARRSGAVFPGRAPARRNAAADAALRGGVSRDRLLGRRRGRRAGRGRPRRRARRPAASVAARDLRRCARRGADRRGDALGRAARPAGDHRHRPRRPGLAHARGERPARRRRGYRRLPPLSRSARPRDRRQAPP